jgi:hypothetical protein
VADEEQRVADVDVGVRAGIAVGAEALDQGPLRRRRAEARIAVEMWCADPGTRQHRERVVLLGEELSARIEAV